MAPPRPRIFTPASEISLASAEFAVYTFSKSRAAESQLLEAGVRLRHRELGLSVAMFATSVQCQPAGRFRGPVVVTMRPIPRDQVEVARQVTADFPLAHGGPIHAGNPAEIGIEDLSRPDFGDPVEVGPDEVPMFWACGVTPQAALPAAKPELAITHAPGHMFITDLTADEIRGRQAPHPLTMPDAL